MGTKMVSVYYFDIWKYDFQVTKHGYFGQNSHGLEKPENWMTKMLTSTHSVRIHNSLNLSCASSFCFHGRRAYFCHQTFHSIFSPFSLQNLEFTLPAIP